MPCVAGLLVATLSTLPATVCDDDCGSYDDNGARLYVISCGLDFVTRKPTEGGKEAGMQAE